MPTASGTWGQARARRRTATTTSAAEAASTPSTACANARWAGSSSQRIAIAVSVHERAARGPARVGKIRRRSRDQPPATQRLSAVATEATIAKKRAGSAIRCWPT